MGERVNMTSAIDFSISFTLLNYESAILIDYASSVDTTVNTSQVIDNVAINNIRSTLKLG